MWGWGRPLIIWEATTSRTTVSNCPVLSNLCTVITLKIGGGARFRGTCAPWPQHRTATADQQRHRRRRQHRDPPKGKTQRPRTSSPCQVTHCCGVTESGGEAEASRCTCVILSSRLRGHVPSTTTEGMSCYGRVSATCSSARCIIRQSRCTRQTRCLIT